MGNRIETVINPASSPLVAPTELMGFSLQIDGKLVPVLDGVALAEGLSRITEITLLEEVEHPDYQLEESSQK